MRTHSFRIVSLAVGAALALTSCGAPSNTAEEGIWVRTREFSEMNVIRYDDDGSQSERKAVIDESKYEVNEQGDVESVYSALDGISYSSRSYTTYKRVENGFMLSKTESSTSPAESGGDDTPRTIEYAFERELDAEGHVTLIEGHPQSGDTFISDIRYEYTYDENGSLTSYACMSVSTKSTDDDKDVTTTQKDTYHFDEHGLATQMVSESTEAIKGKEPTTVIETDAQTWEPANDKHPTKSVLTSDDNSSVQTLSYTYDRNGNLASCSFERNDKDRGVTLISTTTYEWTYIEHPSPAARAAASVFNTPIEL